MPQNTQNSIVLMIRDIVTTAPVSALYSEVAVQSEVDSQEVTGLEQCPNSFQCDV